MSYEVICLTTNNESNVEKVGWCVLVTQRGKGTDHEPAMSMANLMALVFTVLTVAGYLHMSNKSKMPKTYLK